MGEEIINSLIELVKAESSPKDIALNLGNILYFEEFNDGVNQSRFNIESKFGLKSLVAIDNSGHLDWISLDGKNLQLPFKYLENLAFQTRKHYNTYDSVSDVQFVFYPMKEPTINGIFTWVDESIANRKKKDELFVDNVILHFSKKKGPMPSREWLYMVDVPEDILKQNNLHIRGMLHQGETTIEDESTPNTSKISILSKLRNLLK
ncbi:hypothetical protein ACFSKU_09050 [Pontibacter silvestris]|uniref:Uncharacterized protein n=1 Tax=Pontibacter silvestris TaxID=2305183 RepID=A0ABW4WWB5_9BACT|nr:hypothetical protein [Pontibacter silvestris]MCC9139009.1 hypothetical protein [Pontibacter silvestris]